METGRRNWHGWLLVMLFAVFAVTYLWRNFGHDNEGAKRVHKEAANRVSADHTQQISSAPAAVSHSTIEADGTAAVPVQFQLPHVGRVRTARSYQEWLAQFPLYEQPKIKAFNKAHIGVYQVNSREQVAWMAANGYPMPEDLLAAEKLSDKDLLRLAKQGNDKAAFLLTERQNKKLADFLAAGGHKDAYYNGMEGASRINEQMTIERRLKQSNSPYNGYIQASEAASSLYAGQSQDDVDARVIAGLIWAQQLGDMRAGQFMMDYVGQDQKRLVILNTATLVSLNDAESMAFMARSGGQRAVAVGGGIPGGFAPVH